MNPSSELVRAHVWVAGQVQGVGYRAATQEKAKLLRLNGWVRNLRDGRVEAAFEGDRSLIEKMVEWCNEGPTAAKISYVLIRYELPERLQGFKVLPTAEESS
jgi:acylphosphatase